MPLTLRIDLDYVPWDSPDAAEFGHGEPAEFLRLLDLGRVTGYRFHFFVSNRVLRAFPATAEAVLNEGHDLDWLSKHPENQAVRFEDSIGLFGQIGHRARGVAIRDAWPSDATMPPSVEFLSSLPGSAPSGMRHFPVETKPDRDAVRAGMTARTWTDAVIAQIRDCATRNHSMTVSVRPQVLAKFDPRLGHIKEILDMARAVGLPLQTLRQAVDQGK